MFREPKNSDWENWQPCDLAALRLRAEMLADIRAFFKERGVLEVETPLVSSAAAVDPYLHPIPVLYAEAGGKNPQMLYLQTSPEFAMKRLLAAESGPIYQICKAFRNGEAGRLHNPEFTMLEWYRPVFDHHALMIEAEALVCSILDLPKAKRFTYEALFLNTLNLNPHTASVAALKECAFAAGIEMSEEECNQLTADHWLDVLMSHCIEPGLGFECPAIIYDYPASKAALAKIREDKPPVAERFEIYVNGLELANGYHELTDPIIQRKRFEEDSAMRKRLKCAPIPMDERLIAALQAGLPSCAGVALGIDRLLMLKMQANTIRDVLAFTIDRA